jgi:hypothetical protein
MLAAAGLELERVVLEPEERDLDSFLALAGCEGEARRPIFAFAQEALAAGRGGGIGLERDGNNFRFVTTVGWFVARRPQPSA